MAKCGKCGKKGLFLKLVNGLCRDCQQTKIEIKPVSPIPARNIFMPTVITKPVNADFCNFNIPEYVLNLLWFADGKYKNYTPQNQLRFSKEFIEITVTFNLDEPSLISVTNPIAVTVNNIDQIPRPPYFPRYDALTPEQRYIYLKFLENPFNGETDVGYVFLFYYGLERHLYAGSFNSAFEIILKLRQIYKNNSFQNYSFAALAITSLARGRFDLFEKLIAEYNEAELPLGINFLLLTKIYNQKELTADELMRYARRFEFTNTKYIKEYPGLFKSTLLNLLKDIGNIYPYKFLKNAHPQTYKINSFANTSIVAETNIPDYINIFKFKMECYSVLESTHEKVKAELKINRNQYEKVKTKKEPTIIPEESDYPSIEYYLNCELPIKDGELSYNEHPIHYQHLRYYIAIREIYKDRNYLKALNHIIELCKKDIELVIKYGTNPAVGDLNFESFKRLVIIYEKQKEYQKCIDICQSALKIMEVNCNNPFNLYYGQYLMEKLNSLKTKLK